MKRNILLIAMCCLALFYSEANANVPVQPQDSVKIFKKKLDLNLDKMLGKLENLDIDTSKFLDSEKLLALQEELNEQMKDLSEMKVLESLKDLKNTHNYSYSYGNDNFVFNGQDEQPTRTEKKSFPGISEVKVNQMYGTIVVRESSSRQVDLEIQYFDQGNQKRECTVAASNKVLSINTLKPGSGSGARINYIISLPRGTGMNIKLNYGDAIIDKISGAFAADLSYGSLSAQALSGSTLINARYGEVKVDEVQDAELGGAYTDFRIHKAKNVTTSGNYINCRIDELQTLSAGSKSSYGDLRLGTVGSISGSLLYADLVVDNLLSDINVTSTYGDITLKSVSPKVKNIFIKGSYCDIKLLLPANISATFDAKLTYGELDISSAISTRFTESKETDISVVKRGQIGKGNPTAKIDITNVYADITIK